MARVPLVLRARLAPLLLKWASSHRLDAAQLARRCGIPDLGSGEEPHVPLPALRALAAAVARELDDPLLGLHLAQALEPQDYGAIAFLARAGGTVGEALQLFVEHAKALNSIWSVTLERSGAALRVHQRIPGEPLGFGPVGNVFVVSALVLLGRRLHRDAFPSLAWVAHRGRHQEDIERSLGCALELGRGENGIEVPANVLPLRLQTVDPVLAEWIKRTVIPPSTARSDPLEDLRRAMRSSLPVPLALGAAAKLLARSPRSLQRRLADERTTYSLELDRVRSEVASKLLAEGLPLKEVGYCCGFSDLRNFTRAFKRWNGVTPTAARQKVAVPGRR